MNKDKQAERESIVGRIIEFLKLHSPFNIMQPKDLSAVAASASIEYFDKDEIVFHFDDLLHDSIYVIRKGVVRIISKTNELVDLCSEGEIFGARAFMSSEVYQATAQADPEALLIKIPVDALRNIIVHEPRVMEFFFGDFSSGMALRKRKLSEINRQLRSFKPNQASSSFENVRLPDLKSPVKCAETTVIREAATIMRSKKVGSIIVVNEQDFPIGIVTDTDLRNKVVTGDVSIDASISSIMTSPVKTVPGGKAAEEYLMEMVALGTHHLCITDSGTALEPLKGVVTDHDLLVTRGNNAVVLIKELRRSDDDEHVKKVVERFDEHIRNLVMNDHPILDVARIVQGFNRELLNLVIYKSIEHHQLSITEADFCWLALGSTARGEQVIRTDLDSAIVYSSENSSTQTALKQLADAVFEKLIFYGYESDKAGIQANNERWIMSIDEWENQFRKWISIPEEEALLHSTIFFDLMPFFGNAALADQLQKSIYSNYKGNRRYISFLAENALRNPPPLGFFKNLLLEKGGEHKNTFDIKARAMMPLADAARLQTLEFNTMFPSNTIERYKRLMQADDANSVRYEDCAVAYEIFMRMRAYEGLKYNTDGRFVDPSHLTPLEKQVLKQTFEPIASIQHLIKPV